LKAIATSVQLDFSVPLLVNQPATFAKQDTIKMNLQQMGTQCAKHVLQESTGVQMLTAKLQVSVNHALYVVQENTRIKQVKLPVYFVQLGKSNGQLV
jgi:hypothetical protein